MSGQTRLESFIESATNIAIGFAIALVAQILIFPAFGIHIPMGDHLWISVWFTLISLVRSYVIRRWFNARLRTIAHKIARAAS